MWRGFCVVYPFQLIYRHRYQATGNASINLLAMSISHKKQQFHCLKLLKKTGFMIAVCVLGLGSFRYLCMSDFNWVNLKGVSMPSGILSLNHQ